MRLDRLLGRHVYDHAGRRIGRLEEFRARKEGEGWVIDEYVIGAAGLLERLDLGVRRMLGFKPRGYIAKWNQVMLDDTKPIRLNCPVDQLRHV